MSDFMFSTTPKPKGELTRHIQSIYHNEAPGVSEYHGRWGSLAVSRNLYNGFQPYETAEHITVVIGGPVLYFQDNLFLTNGDPVAGTRAIYQRWQRGAMRWDKDLSGPFAILMIDKQDSQISCITDLMMFIPIYQFQHDGVVMLGTHVDALARAAGQTENLDTVSLADFILDYVVTYPYTAYKALRQCHPAAMHGFKRDEQGGVRPIEPHLYWLPEENNPYENIDQAALALRHGLQDYVERVTAGMSQVAQFISAGEDSRSLAGLLPKKLQRDAFVFLDSLNSEGRIAKAAAEAYEAKFHLKTRGKNHYLDILPEAADLVGSGHQYHHAHTLGFHRICELNRYPAVFGGFLSDTLLKALLSRKVRGHGRIPFVPSFFIPGEARSKQVNHDLFTANVLKAITERRRAHLQAVQQMRKRTAHEWFVLWPITMVYGMPLLYSNRRLFRSYEPFMAKEVVKISAAVPTSWKLNRRLFHKAMRPFLQPTRWLFHADGRLPYFPWYINMPVQFAVWFSRHIASRIKPNQGIQGSWGDWDQIIHGPEWQQAIELYAGGFKHLNKSMTKQKPEQALNDNSLNTVQKFNLMQVIYGLSKRDHSSIP
jgi:hypothetical protein